MIDEQAKAELAFAKCVVELMRAHIAAGKPITLKQAIELLERMTKA